MAGELDIGDDDLALVRGGGQLPQLPGGLQGAGNRGKNPSGDKWDASHYVEVGIKAVAKGSSLSSLKPAPSTGPLFKSDNDQIVAVNGIPTWSGDAGPRKTSVIGRPGFEKAHADAGVAQQALQAAQASGNQDEIAKLTRELDQLERQKAHAGAPDDSGAGKGMTVTNWPTSTKQGLSAIRRLTMPETGADGESIEREPVQVAMRRTTGKTEYVKAKYVGPVTKRSQNWDEDVVVHVEMLKGAADMYKTAAFAEIPAFEVGQEDTFVTKQLMAFGHPFMKEVKGPPMAIMSMPPDEKMRRLKHVDHSGGGAEVVGPAAVELMKRDANKVFADVAREVYQKLAERVQDETIHHGMRDRALAMLDRLKGIAQLDTDAMSSVVSSKSGVAGLVRQATDLEKRAATSPHPTGMMQRARKLREQAQRMYNPAADKFDALIALIAYANLSRSGSGVGRYEQQKPHPNMASVRSVQSQTGRYFPPKDDDKMKLQGPRPGRAPGKTIDPTPPHESRTYWVEKMLFSILESRGAGAALKFMNIAHTDLKNIREGQVVLYGFKGGESFLNGLSGKIVEQNEAGVIVTLNDTPRVKQLLAPEDRTLRIAPAELIVVAGVLKS